MSRERSGEATVPTAYVIAGPNGAGKTTFAAEFLPESDIRRRFAAGIRNLFGLYRPLLDGWWLYDASPLSPRLIATDEGGEFRVTDAASYERITRHREG